MWPNSGGGGANYKCVIDHWAGECRDVTPIKLQCEHCRYFIIKKKRRKKMGERERERAGVCKQKPRIEVIIQLQKKGWRGRG